MSTAKRSTLHPDHIMKNTLSIIIAIPILSLSSCTNDTIRMGSHSIYQQYGTDQCYILSIDSEGGNAIRLIDSKNNGTFDIVEIIKSFSKRYTAIFGENEMVLSVIENVQGNTTSYDGHITINDKIYKCLWTKKGWLFAMDDKKQYYVKLATSKDGYRIVPVE